MLKYIKCNICGSNNYKMINKCRITNEDAEVSVGQGYLNLVKCKTCGLIFVNPQPEFSFEQIEKLYSEDYFNKGYMKFYADRVNKSVQSNEPFSFRLDWIEKFKKLGRILDIGSATGGFLNLARQRGWAVEGVEISDYAIEYAKKEYNINAFKGTLEQAQFKDDYFDVIYASDILEHINSPSAFLREVRRILKNDGLFYLAMPNAASFYYNFFGLISRFNHRNYFLLPYHIYHFSPKTIRRLLDRAGFEIADLRFSHSRSKSLFMNIFNFRDRLLVIAKKKQ